MAEYMIIAFFFLVVVLTLCWVLFTRAPAEIAKAQEQATCGAAEGLATAFFDLPGEPVNWNTSNIELFGLATGNISKINASKWSAAKDLGYINVRNKTSSDASFWMRYSIYAFGWGSDSPNPANCSTVLLRQGSTLSITANSTAGPLSLYLDLLFPLILPDQITLYTDVEPAEDRVTNRTIGNSTLISLELHVNTADQDAVNISLAQIPDLVYIKKASYANPLGIKYPIYLRDLVILDEFGSFGYISIGKRYCSIDRRVLMVADGESFPCDLKLLVW